MLGINCLIKNTQIRENIKDLVAYTGFQLAEENNPPTVEAVFQALRQSGVEVDIQSVAGLYQEVFDLDDPMFSSKEEVDLASGRGLSEVLAREVQIIRTNELGRDSQVVSVVRSMINAVSPSIKNNPTLSKLFEERLLKAAKSLMPANLRNKTAGKSIEQVMSEALLLDKNNDLNGLGLMENGRLLFAKFKEGMDEAADIAENNNHYKAAEIRQLADAVMNGTMEMLMSTSEVNKVIMEGLKGAGYTSVTNLANGATKETVNWNKVFNDPSISPDTVLQQAFGSKGFSTAQLNTISRSLKNQWTQVLNAKAHKVLDQRMNPADAVQVKPIVDAIQNALGLFAQTGNLFLKDSEIQRVISGVIKSVNQGTLTKPGTDGKISIVWNEVFQQGVDYKTALNQFMKESVNEKQLEFLESKNVPAALIEKIKGNGLTQTNIDALTKSLPGNPSILDSQSLADLLYKQTWFNMFQIAEVYSATSQTFDNMLAERKDTTIDNLNKERSKPERKAAMDRMLSLYNLGIFEKANQKALLDLMGVSAAEKSRIKQLGEYMEVYKQALKLPSTKYSPTFIKTIQRSIENLIEKAEESGSKGVSFMRSGMFITQAFNALLISNVQNVVENTSSGMYQFMLTAVRNPRQATEAIKVGWDVFNDVMRGGVRVGNDMSNAFNASGDVENRYNFETAKTIGEKVFAGVNLMARAMLSTMDNGIKAGMIQMITARTTVKYLSSTGGMSKADAYTLVNETLYGNQAEIENVAKVLESLLHLTGENIAKGKWKRMAGELSRMNLLSENQFFKDTLIRLKAENRIATDANPTIDDRVLSAIIEAAESTAGKGLGHEADNVLMEKADALVQNASDKVAAARQKKGKGLTNALGFQMMTGALNRFRSGSLKWMWLSFQKSSGLSLATTLLSDVIYEGVVKEKGKNAFKNMYDIIFNGVENINFGEDNKDLVAEVKTATALQERIARSTIAPIMAYMVFLPALQALCGGDGDDDEKKKHLKQFAKDLLKDDARLRWAQKLLSPMAFNYLSNIAWRNNYGTVETKKIKDFRLPSDPVNMFSPALALQAFANNYHDPQTVAITDAFMGFADSKKSAAASAGYLAGSLLNMGAPLKWYQMNQDAITGAKHLTISKRKHYKPDDVWEGVLQSTMNKDFYRWYKDKK